jgi:pimeloyl-ACP methyl ester carboxylesterase
MFRAASPTTLNAPHSDLSPDRTGTIKGLSLTGFHTIAYADWGPQNAEVPVFCVHGLSRQGRDFDYLAYHLADGERQAVCPDLVGRGHSGRLRNPDEYALPQYCADMNALIAHIGKKKIDWVGTSLGGLIGIVLAGLPGSPIRRIVINDIAPYLPWAGLSRIGQYVTNTPKGFSDLDEAEAYFRMVLAPYGLLADDHWRHITEHSVEWDQDQQRYRVLCDPQIARAFRNPWHYSLDLWKYWRAIDVPILVLRGVHSDLLPEDLAIEMKRRNARMQLVEIANCGHAPTLMTPDQIQVVSEFLNA